MGVRGVKEYPLRAEVALFSDHALIVIGSKRSVQKIQGSHTNNTNSQILPKACRSPQLRPSNRKQGGH
jgi:hypothetical protein